MQFDDYISPERRAGADHIRLVVAKAEGRKPPLPLPEWIVRIHDAIYRRAYQIARRAQAESGRFFYIPYHLTDPESPRRWDEVETSKVFHTLLTRTSLEYLPGYSPGAHTNAIDFWQSWQNSDNGTFHNPRFVNPQDPTEIRDPDPEYHNFGTNAKYIPIVLDLLGAEPLLQPQIHGSNAGGGVDYEELWRTIIDEPYYNHGGAMVNGMLRRIANGYDEYTQAAEYAMSHTVNLIDTETGIFPRRGISDWADYGAIEPTLKSYGRLIGQQAVEHMPDERIQAFTDWLLQHRRRFAAKDMDGNMRNTTELLIHALQYHDYRRDEIIEGLENQMNDLESRPQIWETDYSRYNTVLLASFLCGSTDLAKQLVTPYQGGWFAHRPVMGPFSAWVNLIPKRDEELAEHPGWNYETHGLKLRNARHRSRRIREVTPQLGDTSQAWRYLSTRPTGRWKANGYDDSGWSEGVPPVGMRDLWFRKTIGKKIDDEVEPWLVAEWSGEYDVYIGGVPVKRVIKGFRKCGWYVPPEAKRAMLSPHCILAVRSQVSSEKSFLRLGVVDWR